MNALQKSLSASLASAALLLAAGVSYAAPSGQASAVTAAPADAASTLPEPAAVSPAFADLDDPVKKEIAMRLVSSAENSSMNWRKQYAFIKDIHDGRGYTAGIIGFCSGTGDMLAVVRHYTELVPGNTLARYLPALEALDGSDAHTGLDPDFVKDWKAAAKSPLFQQSQDWERDRVYFGPAVRQGKADGVHALGQFIYYDALVMHGPGETPDSFGGIRAAALKVAKPPAQGGDEAAYLNAFLDARVIAMRREEAHSETSRVDTAQRVFLQRGNLDLRLPLDWKVYGEPFSLHEVTLPPVP